MNTSRSHEGDDGYTNLLGEGRVPKYHLRPRTFGTVDEVSAALGVARALDCSPETDEVIRAVQRDLYHLMAEVAAVPEEAERFRQLDATRVEWLEVRIDEFEREVEIPSDFVFGADSPSGAALNLARTVVRRAERLTAKLMHEGELENQHILNYLNRLSSLCFVLMLWEDHRAGVDHPNLIKGGGE